MTVYLSGKIKKVAKKSLKITGIGEFDPVHFLRGIHRSSIGVELSFIIDGRTTVFLSAFGRSLSTSKAVDKATLRLNVIKDLLGNCSFEDVDRDISIPDGCQAMIHVMGYPNIGELQLERLVSSLLEAKIKSGIFINLEPCSVISTKMDSPFKVTFLVVVVSSNREYLRRHIRSALSLVHAFYGGEKSSIRTIIMGDRKARKWVEKLSWGEQLYSTILDAEHTSVFFGIPQSYGIGYARRMNFPLPPQPLKGFPIGESVETNIQEIKSVKFDTSRIFEHMVLWGATGTGKSTFIKNLLLKLVDQGVKFCVLDWHNEYRNLISGLENKNDLLVLNPFLSVFSVNPLELPAMENRRRESMVSERIENFISLLRQMFILGEIQESRVRRSLYESYEQDIIPSIGSLVRILSHEKMDNLSTKLEKFTKGFYGEIFSRRHSSLMFNELRRRNVIIEIGNLPIGVRTFFVCVFLILWWDHVRLEKSAPHVLVLDDFNRYGTLSAVRNMLAEARKYRQGLICSHQGPNQLSREMRDEVIRNTATKVIFRMEQSSDKHAVYDALGGLNEQQMQGLSYLDIGETIVKLPSAKSPIRMNTPPPPELEDVKDSEIRAITSSRMTRRYVEEEIEKKLPEKLTDLEKLFLLEIHSNPDAPITEVTKEIGIKTERGYKLKERLVNAGFLKEDKIRMGRGRPKSVFTLDKKALEMLCLERKKATSRYSSPEHVFIVKRIADILKSQWDVKIEDGCDVKVEGYGKKIAIEVETGKSKDKKQLLYNLERNRTWADKTIIVCPNKKAKLEIQESISNRNEDKLAILTYKQINNLMDFLPKN